MDKNNSETERLKMWQDARQRTTRKVIGWETISNKRFYHEVDDEDGKDLSYTAALINDVAEHHYNCCGYDMDMIPVFDDFKVMDLSERGWGEIMALANDDASDMAYTGYSFDHYMPEAKNRVSDYPNRTAPHFVFLLSHADFERLKKDDSIVCHDAVKFENNALSMQPTDTFCDLYGVIAKDVATGETIDRLEASIEYFDDESQVEEIYEDSDEELVELLKHKAAAHEFVVWISKP